MNIFRFGKREKKKELSELIGKTVHVLDDSEMKQVYGGCKVEYSPITSIVDSIIINEK